MAGCLQCDPSVQCSEIMRTRIEYIGAHTSQSLRHFQKCLILVFYYVFYDVFIQKMCQTFDSHHFETQTCTVGVIHGGPSPDDDAKSDGPVTVVDVHDTQ